MTVVGNRPQFIKMAPVSAALKQAGIQEFVVHTGQHHDPGLSQIFFSELGLPEPNVRLDIAQTLSRELAVHGKLVTQGVLTARMLEALENLMQVHRPTALLVYGDTNSTLAAALAAVKLHIPIIHVEAGPRTGDMLAPEEINRQIVDKIATLNACPDAPSLNNLRQEGLGHTAHNIGDVMLDAYLQFKDHAGASSPALSSLHGEPYALITVHRPDNTDTFEAISGIVQVLHASPLPVVFPVHPRTQQALERFGLWEGLQDLPYLHLLPPVGYLETLALLQQASIVLTDSGGLQKEAFFAKKPVLILLHNTPWEEIEKAGWQVRCWQAGEPGISVAQVLDGIQGFRPMGACPALFGNGMAAQQLVQLLQARFLLVPYSLFDTDCK